MAGLTIKILRVYVHQQRRVCVLASARVITHSVCAHATRSTCRWHHHATWAHAKSVYAAAAGQMNRQLIICRAQGGVVCKFSVLSAVDICLIVLYAHANRKRLALHFHACFFQHFICVTRRMATRQHHVGGGDAFFCRLIFARVLDLQMFNFPALESYSHKLRVKTNFAPEPFNFSSHISHNFAQFICAYVRLCQHFNVFWCARLHKPSQHVFRELVFCVSG